MNRILYTETDPDGRINALLFFCPGCRTAHLVPIVPGRPGYSSTWRWNGDIDSPTFTPSIKIEIKDPQSNISRICHSHVTAGMIQYCSDTTHQLAGKTVPLEDF